MAIRRDFKAYSEEKTRPSWTGWIVLGAAVWLVIKVAVEDVRAR